MKRSLVQKKLRIPFLAAAVSLLLGGGFPLLAGTDAWSGGGMPDGNWSNPANWSGIAPNTTGDNLLFAGNAQPTVTNDLVTSAGWIQLNPTVPFAIAGGSLTLSSGLTNSAQNNFWDVPLMNMVNQNVDVAANTTLTIGANISAVAANFTIAKTSAGTLVLSGDGDNSFMQATINGGTLVLNKDSSSSAHALNGTTETINNGAILQLSGSGGDQINDTSAVMVNNGGTFDLNGQTETVKSLTLNGTGINNTGSLTNSSPNTATLTFNDGTARSSGLGSAATIGGLGDIIFAGVTPFGQSTSQTLTKVGDNTLMLTNGSGLDNHDLTLVVDSGTVILAKPVAPSGAHCVGGLTVKGGTVQLGGSGGYQIYQGASPIINSGGVFDLNGQPQFFTTAAGLTVNGTGIGNNGVLINNNSSVDSTLTGSGASAVTLGSDSSLGGNGNLIISGVISGAGKALTKVGAGLLTLSNAETYSGNTTVSGGTLALTGSGSFSSSPVITVATGATLDVSGISYSLSANQTLSGSGMINGPVTASTGSISPGTTTALGTLTFNNDLTLGNTALTIGFDGAGANNSQINVLGNLINNGTTAISLNAHGLQAGTYTLITYAALSGGGTFALNGTYPNVTLNSPGANSLTITVGPGGSSGGGANLVWKGDGTANNWDLSAANWTFLGGSVAFAQGDAITFDNTGSSTPAINLGTQLSPASVTVNSTNTYIFSGGGSLSGTMALNKSGAGTLVLATANNYTGNTTISAGTLQLGNGGTTGDAGNSPVITLASGGAGADGTGDSLAVNETGSPVFTNGLSLASGNQGVYVNAGQIATFAGPISGGGQLWVNGPGTLVIGDTNTFTSGVVIDNNALGALQINTVRALNGGRVFFGKPSGGTLIYTGTNEDGSSMAGASFFQGAGVHVINIANPATTLTINSNMQGSGVFVKAGLGTLALGTTNTYITTTVVSNGTLALVGFGAIPTTPSITVISNAVFDVSALGSFSLATNQSLGGNGNVVGNIIAATGAAIIPGMSATNPANPTFGTLTFGGNLTVNGSLLTFGFSQDSTVANDQVQVLGNLENDGTTLIALNYGFINPGTYTLMIYTSLSGSGTFVLNGTYPNTTLNVGATSITLTVGGGGSRIGNLVWKGDGIANSWDMQTTSNWVNQLLPDTFHQGDKVTFDNTGSTNSAVSLVGSLAPASVTVNSSNTYTFAGSGQLGGQMNLAKSGTGGLVLATDNAYTGNTTVSAGMVQLGNGGTAGSAGSGTINLVGGGAIVSGTNNVGLVVNKAGSSVIANGLSFASGNQSVYVNAGQTAIFTGPLSGPGQLWVTGPGTMIISNIGSSYTSSNGAVLNNPTAVLQLDSISEFNGLPVFFGHGGGTLTYTGPSADGSGLLGNSDIFQGTTNVINLVNPETTLTVNTVMGGTAAGTAYVVKSGPGTLVYNAINTYSAGTVVSNGTLLVNGQLSSSTVNVVANGKLGGSGLVNTATIQPGGIIQGGDASYSGMFTINSTLNIGMDNNSVTHSQFNLTAGGTLFPIILNVNGTNMVDIQDASLSAGTSYPLIFYGAITYGATAGFQLGRIPPGVTASVQDVGGEIDLVVTSVLPPPPTFGGITTLPDHNFELNFSGPSGQNYTILTSTNLALPLSSWTPASTGTFGSTSILFDDLDATNHPQRFYLITSP